MWRELRTRGFAFSECEEIQCDPRELDRLDLLWGVTRSLLLHELERPLPLLTRYVFDALELGEPLRVVRGLAMFHVHVDLPFSKLSKLEPSGALDVAEALARRLDQVEARAVIAFARGLAVFHNGLIEPALQELKRAEDLYRNHCRGGAFEMRMSRMVISHIQITMYRDTDTTLLREWVREAEDRGDRVSCALLKLATSQTLLRSDQADVATSQLEAIVQAAGGALSSTGNVAQLMARGAIQLYRGNADGCRASFYLLDEFFTMPLAQVPVWRGLGTLLRARLALVARAGAGANRTFVTRARASLEETEKLGVPCFNTDVHLLRAAVAVASGQTDEAIQALAAVLATPHDPSLPPLALLIARRARGQLVGGTEGYAQCMQADEMLAQRGVVNPRRFARLFVPGLEELSTRYSERPPTL
jgi:hypothetical protein